jgi:hypothetical protein
MEIGYVEDASAFATWPDESLSEYPLQEPT